MPREKYAKHLHVFGSLVPSSRTYANLVGRFLADGHRSLRIGHVEDEVGHGVPRTCVMIVAAAVTSSAAAAATWRRVTPGVIRMDSTRSVVRPRD